MDPLAHPHRRYNPLTGRAVLVSTGRLQRPWQGQTESSSGPALPPYDPTCYLCPGNQRAGDVRNPDYEGPFAFENDFPALREDTPAGSVSPHPLLRAQTQAGTSRVLCFHPRHDLSLARMDVSEIRAVVDLWAEQLADLSRRFAWVQLFENRGEAMGASNPHPHGQVWASALLPDEAAVEDRQQREYFHEHGAALLVAYGEVEATRAERLVIANDEWLAVVPFWATWPFETLLLPRRPVARLTGLDDGQRSDLAAILRGLLVRYDNLFEHPFPYSMGWHGAPGDGDDAAHWQLHAHFYPPLLRSASVRKFSVGYEMLAEPQRDLTAEDAAERLRQQAGTHYLDGGADERG